MQKEFRRFWLSKSIAVIMMAIATSLLVGCPGSTSPFNYQVQVLDSETGKPIEGALVIIATGGKAPIGDDANTHGFAIIRIDGSYVGIMSEVTITAPGYKGYFTDVNLKEGALPKTIRLKREMGSGETQPTATPAPSVTDTPLAPISDHHTPTTQPIQAYTPTTQPTTPPNTATPMPPSSPLADAAVLENGAELRPGTDTWWYARQTLPARTELELLGYDPNFADWIYVRTVDGTSTGWTQTASLQINVQLSALPRVTPRPTLTATPGGVPVPPGKGCEGGPLSLTFYSDPGSESCTPGGGWQVNIHFIASGGNCTYIYYWQDALIFGPTTERELIYAVKHGSSAALVGNGEVRSGSETVKQGLYVDCPTCP